MSLFVVIVYIMYNFFFFTETEAKLQCLLLRLSVCKVCVWRYVAIYYYFACLKAVLNLNDIDTYVLYECSQLGCLK